MKREVYAAVEQLLIQPELGQDVSADVGPGSDPKQATFDAAPFLTALMAA